MERNTMSQPTTRFYMLQPGEPDGTRYVFALTWPPVPELWLEEGYVQITIIMPGWQGSYASSVWSLKNLAMHHVGYLASHMSQDARLYTIAAVCLAAGILTERPDALEEAAMAMLKAPGILADLPE